MRRACGELQAERKALSPTDADVTLYLTVRLTSALEFRRS